MWLTIIVYGFAVVSGSALLTALYLDIRALKNPILELDFRHISGRLSRKHLARAKRHDVKFQRELRIRQRVDIFFVALSWVGMYALRNRLTQRASIGLASLALAIPSVNHVLGSIDYRRAIRNLRDGRFEGWAGAERTLRRSRLYTTISAVGIGFMALALLYSSGAVHWIVGQIATLYAGAFGKVVSWLALKSLEGIVSGVAFAVVSALYLRILKALIKRRAR
jgi:hypothetical protein